MNLAEAKARITIHHLWRHFGFEGEPSKSCRCPFHDDRSASFSVTEDGGLWHCFAVCGGGDAVDFFATAIGLPHAGACRAFIALAGGSPLASLPRPPRQKPADVEAAKARQRETWPLFESPLDEANSFAVLAVDALSKLRHVSVAGVRLMVAHGLLWFAAWKELPAWIVTDGERVNAQARGMDGKLWHKADGKEIKAQTLPGSRAAWPIGLKESAPFPFVLLCEGGPDLLAAHHFIVEQGREADTASVGMLGASLDIPPDALPFFEGKVVRIMAHADEAGSEAAANWAGQLAGVAAHVDAVSFDGLVMADGKPVEDLNDLARMAPLPENELENLIPNETEALRPA